MADEVPDGSGADSQKLSKIFQAVGDNTWVYFCSMPVGSWTTRRVCSVPGAGKTKTFGGGLYSLSVVDVVGGTVVSQQSPWDQMVTSSELQKGWYC